VKFKVGSIGMGFAGVHSGMTRSTPLSITVTAGTTVSAIAMIPDHASCCLAFAPGAGGGINQPYIVAVCEGLAARGMATVRYQFPSMEKGTRRPDPPKICHETIQAAVAAAHELLPALALFAGGKSFGGRMTSQIQAIAPLPDVCGLCFFGFPLHPPKRPATTRADHLSLVHIPMLFLQGTRDDLADLTLMQEVIGRLNAPVTLKVIDQADHSFHVPARGGRSDAEVMSSMLEDVVTWAASNVAHTQTARKAPPP
jgi:predicted alpha/beta-hydrolase family hydrolase